MIHPVLPVTHTFNQQAQRRRQAEPHRPVARSRLQVDVRSGHTGRKLQRGDRLLLSSPQARADRIAQLRHAVESGNYCVSAEQIAEKMVQEDLVAMLT